MSDYLNYYEDFSEDHFALTEIYEEQFNQKIKIQSLVQELDRAVDRVDSILAEIKYLLSQI